jgi:hypothetical protein
MVLLVVVYPFVKYAWVETWEYVGGDFETFLKAAKHLARGETPYPSEVLDKAPGAAIGEAWGNYIYPPLFARLLIPFSWLSPLWAKRSYLFICLCFYCWLLLPRKKGGFESLPIRWIAWALFFGWGPIIHAFRHGQSDFIPLFLITWAWFELRKKEKNFSTLLDSKRKAIDFLAGFLVGIAAMVKITPVLIFPVLVVTRRWWLAFGFAAGSFSALLLSGPFTSWQYFTQVLPNMVDFAGMRHCPSIHIGLLNLFDQLPVPLTWESHWHRLTEILAVGMTGMLYAGVLLWFLFNRLRMTSADLLLVACFIPPLFAGEVGHHYALTLLPVLEGVRRLMVQLKQEATLSKGTVQEINIPSIKRIISRAKFLILLVGLLPNFYYWAIFTFPIAALLPFDLATLLVVGNIGVALLLAPFFLGHLEGRIPLRPNSPPASIASRFTP